MKQKLIALGAIVAIAALFAARIPSFHSANAMGPTGFDLSVTTTACVLGDPSCASPDTNVDNGESFTSVLHTGLPTDGEAFYDSVRTTITGIVPPVAGTVPTADTVGSGSFTIKLATTSICSAAAGTLPGGPYTIYATNDAGVGYPSLGYAKGLGSGELWSTYAGSWIQDFDDDDNNNIPDAVDNPAHPPAESTLAMTTRDAAVLGVGAAGVPAGVYREPLYMPILDALSGQTHNARSFGKAVVAPGVVEVAVDFVSYYNYPTAGQTTQIAVIGEGGALVPAIQPASPSGSNQATCPPFTSDITSNNKSSSGVVLNKAAASGPIGYTFEASLGADGDGDGVNDYQDNCDQVANPTQLDTDGNGIGDACDNGLAPGTAIPALLQTGCPGPNPCTALDWDGDGFNSYLDSCPYSKNAVNSDGDGADNVCDGAPSIVGNGKGYSAGYGDRDATQSLSVTLPHANSSTVLGGAATEFLDSNDNHIPDASETAGDLILGSGVKPGDSDGDGVLDGADADALNPGLRSAACVADCDHDASIGLFNNVYGDGCPDVDEPAITIGGTPLSASSPWDFYNVPVPALFAAPTPKTTFRGTGTLSAAMAQAVFGYFKKAAKLGTQIYNQDLNQNNVMDGFEYDRKVSGAGPPIAPDGTISAADAQKAFAEFKQVGPSVKCTSPGGYKMNDYKVGP